MRVVNVETFRAYLVVIIDNEHGQIADKMCDTYRDAADWAASQILKYGKRVTGEIFTVRYEYHGTVAGNWTGLS